MVNETFRRLWPYVLFGVGLIGIQIIALRSMGEPFVSSQGFHLWNGDTQGSRNSQDLFDPYSFVHILFGMLFYWILSFFSKKLSPEHRLLIVLILEVCWELVENSSLVVDRYRTATVAFGYRGDTIINSVSDVLCNLFGFWLAMKLPTKISLVLFLVIEAALLSITRDDLALNALMLLYPLHSVKIWQLGGM